MEPTVVASVGVTRNGHQEAEFLMELQVVDTSLCLRGNQVLHSSNLQRVVHLGCFSSLMQSGASRTALVISLAFSPGGTGFSDRLQRHLVCSRHLPRCCIAQSSSSEEGRPSPLEESRCVAHSQHDLVTGLQELIKPMSSLGI